MPKGFIETSSGNGGGADYFDLKKDGDTAVIRLMGEPFILDIHRLPDPDKPYGMMFPCGTKDRNACPICEDRTGAYGPDEKKTATKCYYPVYVHSWNPKGTKPQKVGEMKVMSGGNMLHLGFMACYESMTNYGGDIFSVPLIVTRSGERQNTTFNVQAHPNPAAVSGEIEAGMEAASDAPDVENLAIKWLEKAWSGIGYDATGGGIQNAPGTAEEDADDPFKKIPAAA